MTYKEALEITKGYKFLGSLTRGYSGNFVAGWRNLKDFFSREEGGYNAESCSLFIKTTEGTDDYNRTSCHMVIEHHFSGGDISYLLFEEEGAA